MAAPSKEGNNIDRVAAATGGSMQIGNTASKEVTIRDASNRDQAHPDEVAAPPPSIPDSRNLEEEVNDLKRQIADLQSQQASPPSDEEATSIVKLGDMERNLPAGEQEIADVCEQFKTQAGQQESEEMTEEESKKQGFAQASPNFQEVDKSKAAASTADEKAASLRDNKIDEVEVETEGGTGSDA